MITHIVFFKLVDQSKENIEKTQNVLLGMEGKIPVLRHLEVGIDVVRSERSYDLALITKFDSLDDLQSYQIHPVHQEIIKFINSVKDTSISIDYESNK